MKVKVQQPALSTAYLIQPFWMKWYHKQAKKLLKGEEFRARSFNPDTETYCIYVIYKKNGDYIEILAEHIIDKTAGKMKITPLSRVESDDKTLNADTGYISFKWLS